MIYKNKDGEVLRVKFSSRKGKFIIPSIIADYKCSEIESKDTIIICTSDCEPYKVSPNVSFDRFNIDSFLASDKEAIVKHFVEKLCDFRAESENIMKYYEYLLKRAKEL